MSLTKDLKEVKAITTDIGEFTFIDRIGEGGNSEVFKFKKKNTEIYYAVKFLKLDLSDSKLSRIRDEYFCTQKIHTHKNLARYYHFDKIKVKEKEYFIRGCPR